MCGSQLARQRLVRGACSPSPTRRSLSYSGTTGKRLKALYQWHGPQCLSANTTALWTDSDGSTVIVCLVLSVKGIKVTALGEQPSIGIVVGGHLTGCRTGRPAD